AFEEAPSDGPGQGPGRVEVVEGKDGRTHVDEAESLDLAGGLAGSAVHDEDAVPVMVGPVGAGVVLVREQTRVADRAHGAPRQVAEVDEEVGGDAADLRIDVLRLEDPRPEGRAVRSGSGFELLDQLVSGRFVPRGFDDTLRLATLDVEEQSSVIAAVAPRRGPGPIDRDVLERNRASV